MNPHLPPRDLLLCTNARSLAGALLCVVGCASGMAFGQSDTPSTTASQSLSQEMQENTLDARLAAARAATPHAWGSEGSEWWTFTAGGAADFADSHDLKLGAGYTTFVVDDVEFTVEAGLWYFDQPGDDAVGASGSMIFRWHFINEQSWSLFADAGIGMMVASDNVPDGGTGFDVLPRFGLGATMQLDDAGTRAQVGFHWHHISNARIHGEDRNPSRDGLMLYAGIIVPF